MIQEVTHSIRSDGEHTRRSWAGALWYYFHHGATCYVVSLALVLAGIATSLLTAPYAPRRSPDRVPPSGDRFRDTFTQWDGQWYIRIASRGYGYDPDRMSEVAFFPLYPIVGRAIASALGIPVALALLLVSHAFLIVGLTIFAAYLAPSTDRHGPPAGLWALALFPTSFFMFMAYSESFFLAMVALVMLGLRRRWPSVALVVVAGVATAVRPVGVALLPPIVYAKWREQRSMGWRLVTSLWMVLLGASGLLLYMAYQQVAFGNPLAFAQTQTHWRRVPPLPLWQHAAVLLSGEPIWSVYIPRGPAYWGTVDGGPCAFASLQAANPILFVIGVVSLWIGAYNRFLTRHELVLGAGLLAIPYIGRSYEMCMASHGRFALVVLPVFVAMGHVLARVSPPWRLGWLCASGFYVFVYSWMWTNGYVLI